MIDIILLDRDTVGPVLHCWINSLLLNRDCSQFENIVQYMVAHWLRCCATNRKVAGSNPAGDIGIFH